MRSQFLNLIPNRFETAFRAVCCASLLLIDLKFTIQLDLSSIFSISYCFSTKIVGGDNVNHLMTKITMPLLAYFKIPYLYRKILIENSFFTIYQGKLDFVENQSTFELVAYSSTMNLKISCEKRGRYSFFSIFSGNCKI